MDDTGATMPLSGFSEDRTNRPPHFHVSESIARNERNSRIWAEIFSSNQKQDESVAQYGDRIIVLVDQLTDISLELRGLMVFYRVKTGLLGSIKKALSMQIAQPTSHATLNDVATFPHLEEYYLKTALSSTGLPTITDMLIKMWLNNQRSTSMTMIGRKSRCRCLVDIQWTDL